jgi:hypothetical protein
MTKTFSTVVPNRCTNLCPPVFMAFFGTNVVFHYLFGVLNLGHWDLFEIWFLVLGISIKQVISIFSTDYLLNNKVPLTISAVGYPLG